jgi:hypothetical protein
VGLRLVRQMSRQGNYIILINTKRVRLRHWNIKTEKPEQLAPSNLLNIKIQEQGSLNGLPAFVFLFEMLTSC